MKKAVFVVSALRGGGAEKFVLNLYKALEKYEKYECHIISIDKVVDYSVDGFRVYFVSDICNISKKGWRRLFYKQNIAKSIDAFVRRDLGEDTLVISNMLLSDKIMSKSKLNVYHVIHSAYTSSFLLGKNLFSKIKICAQINAIYKNHPLIFVSHAAKESFFESFKSKNSSYVIHNPINREEIILASTEKYDELSEPYIIHIGRLNRAKRHDRLLKAFSEISDKSIKLVLLGDGKLRKSILALIEQYGLSDRVVLLGFKINPYVYLRNSKGLVLSSDFEGLPTVILEALTLGIPVISTHCPGGIGEILHDSSKSLCKLDNVHDLAEKIDDMLINPEYYISNVKDSFNPKVAAREYSKLP